MDGSASSSSSVRRTGGVRRRDVPLLGPGRPARHVAPGASTFLRLTVLAVTAVGITALPVAADSGTGSRSSVVDDAVAPACTYRAPVEGRVVDGFRLDAGQYGAGNRGLEYETASGGTARAIAAGEVAFAGSVAGRLVVSIEHPDGRRSSLTGLASVRVSVGDLVHRSAPVGSTGDRLHLGVREAGHYVDPGPLICPERRSARLVPVPGRPGGCRSSPGCRGGVPDE